MMDFGQTGLLMDSVRFLFGIGYNFWVQVKTAYKH